ncbi:MAG TPA: TetR/AcrR family transcriptional regulator [Solirubrobacteraceae bacterium]|jgi:AcrR family transcriptional regulator|nr:TetR/AcrR family transcriptional regulator [Solirubrobacteraceae bacterium]
MSARRALAPVPPARSSRARRAQVGARRDALKRNARRDAVSPRVQVAGMQRSRLLSAAVATVDELGYARASVAHITARARVSRRTFYDLFENREDCLSAVLEDVLGRVEDELSGARLDGLPWRERVRTGLLTILAFFDREPVLARVCVVQALGGGPRVLADREEILARVARVLDQGRREGVRAGECPSLTAEGLVGAAFAIVYARLLRGDREPLTGLLGDLMGMIVLPYLGPAAARREQVRAVPAPAIGQTARVVRKTARVQSDPLEGIPMRLTYRTALVLERVAQNPGASNRLIGEQADVYDQGQISKLLGRLERIGLLANTGEGHAKGEPNAWRLTERGLRVTESFRAHAHNNREATS